MNVTVLKFLLQKEKLAKALEVLGESNGLLKARLTTMAEEVSRLTNELQELDEVVHKVRVHL